MRHTLAFEVGDLAERRVDALVNPVGADWLVGHTGMHGALRSRGGETFAAACLELPGLDGRHVRVTRGGDLLARWVLHVRCPVTRLEVADLESIHRQSIERADLLGCETVALPAIDGGFPSEVAAKRAVSAVEAVLGHTQSVCRVEFVVDSQAVRNSYAACATDETLADANGVALRAEIVGLLGRSPELAGRVAGADDNRLRAIDGRARSLLGDLQHTSLSVAAAYTRAVELELAT